VTTGQTAASPDGTSPAAPPRERPDPRRAGALPRLRLPWAARARRATALPLPRLRLLWALAVALVGGLLLAAAFPPLGWWPFAFVGPAMLVFALSGRSLRGAFTVGFVFGVAFFTPLLAWVVNLAWFAWVALAIASAVIFAVFAIAQRLLLNLRGWPVAVAGWWVAAEAFRDRWPWGGFPWGRLAMSQAGLPTQGWAAIFGPPVLTFVVALCAAVLAWLVTVALAARVRSADQSRPSRRRLAVTAGLAVAGTACLAVLPAALPLDPVPANAKTAVVAAVQGNVPRARSLVSELNDYEVTTQNHMTATEKLASEVKAGKLPAPDLVIWPENSTSIDPDLDPQIYSEIATAVSAIDRPILVGEVQENPERNDAVLWLPGKGPTTTYVKRRLVPFGEYVPFRSLISKITSLTQLQPIPFVPGHQTVVFNVGQVKLGDVICYEIAFDDLVRSEVDAGANLLSMQSNDATFEREGPITEESGQQLAMARIRAVEFDRAVVVSSTTGYSAIIAPDGQVISRTGMWEQAELEARVPLLTYTTLANRVGAWPEWAIVALTALAFARVTGQAIIARRRARATRSAKSAVAATNAPIN
jgi:apolipoprotein N-acyltransferase